MFSRKHLCNLERADAPRWVFPTVAAVLSNALKTMENHRWAGPVVVGAAVFLSRIAFLDSGYGLDADAWRMVDSSRTIARTGFYTVSRFPGYPIPELTFTLLAGVGPFVLNGLTAIHSALASAFMALSLKQLGVRRALLPAAAFAFVPLVYINSTNSMDYLWAMSFLMAALYATVSKRPILAGVLVGLATGCRITSLAMLAPLSIYIISTGDLRSWREIAKLSLAATATAALVFTPVFAVYGGDFLTYYGGFQGSVEGLVRMMTLEVLGRTGLFVLLVLITIRLAAQRHNDDYTVGSDSWNSLRLLSLAVIVVYVAIFLRLPHEAGYLIPVVPFVLILLHRWLRSRLFAYLVLALLVSSFATVTVRKGVTADGVLRNQQLRCEEVTWLANVSDRISQLESPAVVVTGWFLPKLEVTRWASRAGPELVYLLDELQLQQYQRRAYQIYYIPAIADYNESSHSVDLATVGEPLVVGGD